MVGIQLIYFNESALNNKGNIDFTLSTTHTSLQSEQRISLMSEENFVSYSHITCRHEPQGVMGDSNLNFSEKAVTAMVFILTPG